MEAGQKVRLRATGTEVTVHQVRASGVVVVVEANGHHFGVVESELTELADVSPEAEETIEERSERMENYE